MVKRILVILFSAAVLFIALLLLVPTEKDRFKEDVKAFAGAVEQEDIPAAMTYISPEYQDGNGLIYESFSGIIENMANQFEKIEVHISGLKVYIDSTDAQGVFYAHCSLGLKLFAHYQGEKTLVYGGVVRPSPVRAWFKKSIDHYQLYTAIY
jgi:hypothetical protein